MKKLLIGGASGLLIGILDCVLFALSGQPVTTFDVGSALTFWSAVGAVIQTAQIGIPPLAKGLVFALVLNIPWGINFAGAGMPEVIGPMIAMGLTFGAILGVASGKIDRHLAQTPCPPVTDLP